MKTIEVDDDLYQYIASQTQHIGESASSILRRILKLEVLSESTVTTVNSINSFKKNVDISSILKLINSDDFSNEKKTVNRFLLLLSHLYMWNSSRFSLAAASLHGSKRRYLAKDELTLLESGNNTKPKAIPNTPYWVVTNSNTERKSHILGTIMKNMEFSQDMINDVMVSFSLKNKDE